MPPPPTALIATRSKPTWRSRSRTGADTLAMIRLGGREAVARLRAETGARAGERRRFMVDMSKAVLFDPETEMRL